MYSYMSIIFGLPSLPLSFIYSAFLVVKAGGGMAKLFSLPLSFLYFLV